MNQNAAVVAEAGSMPYHARTVDERGGSDFMVGPVLYQEMLLGGRRGRQYVFRWLYAGWLIVQVLYFYMTSGMGALFSGATTPVLADVASRFVHVFVIQQLVLLVLVTPAF